MDYIVWSLICAVVLICAFAVVFPCCVKMFLSPRLQLSADGVGRLIFVRLSNIGAVSSRVYKLQVVDLSGRVLDCSVYRILRGRNVKIVQASNIIVVHPGDVLTVVLRCDRTSGAYVIVSTSDGTYKVPIQHIVA